MPGVVRCMFSLSHPLLLPSPVSQEAAAATAAPVAKTNQYTQAEDGKTEMSLLYFTLTNPGWRPSGDSERYLAGLREAANRDLAPLAAIPEQRA